MKNFSVTYDDITSVENLLCAWQEFVKGKRGKKDVQEFQLHLMDNLLSLRRDLVNETYQHGSYHAFNISDPKPRNIHKASVRDRLLHHVIYRKLYQHYDSTFIADSFSCRKEKGTRKALNRFRKMCFDISRNNTKTVWILKCDIKKFFASINHSVLLTVLRQRIADERVLGLLENVIGSFYTTENIGLPLGSLTSQLLTNVYMNEFDQHMKQMLRVKNYIRYADDFVVFSHDRKELIELLPKIGTFLKEHLKLTLHPEKVFIKTLASGIDFLGWVHFPDHRVLRTTTKRRMFKNLSVSDTPEASRQSYLGTLRWGNTEKLKTKVDWSFPERGARGQAK
jgi:retron-type reverse transcriptase